MANKIDWKQVALKYAQCSAMMSEAMKQTVLGNIDVATAAMKAAHELAKSIPPEAHAEIIKMDKEGK